MFSRRRAGGKVVHYATFMYRGEQVNELVGAEQLLPRALELARTIAGNAPVSVRQLKRLLRRTWDVDLETMMQYEVDGMLACLASEDIEEGLRAFAERRRPVWKGR